MLCAHFIAGARLDGGTVPVQVVDLQLHKFGLWVALEYLGQQVRTVVERETDVADAALGLLAGEETPAVHLLYHLDALAVEGMEPVVVEVVHAALFQLFVEDALQVGLFIDGPHGHLGGHGEGLTRVALDHRFAQGLLALAAVIGIGGVKVGEPLLDKAVGHCLELLDIDARLVVRVGERQAHQSKSKFSHIYFLIIVLIVSSTG